MLVFFALTIKSPLLRVEIHNRNSQILTRPGGKLYMKP